MICSTLFNNHISISYPPRRLFSLLVNAWYSEQPRGFVNSIWQVTSEHRITMIWFLWRWAWFADVELDPTFFTSLRQLSACLCNSYASSVFVQAGRPWPGQGQVVQSLCSVWAFSLQPDNLNLNRLTLRSISYIIDHYCIYASSVHATLQFRLCREGFLFVCLFVCLFVWYFFVASFIRLFACFLPACASW